ncbi:phosphoribosylanthranilate isomerase [Chryseobacterium paridis]|uniref:N-(5'-phosphoribosyl)anthranilate isomerase n=1 Tax=Chryseobacterium paridis TaxID=2800328 RepID=A0ABS1FTX4_9FLAO|nr:phosphoribosylanthranilate isomerase [Chryseobacterium paridis]MBK1895831.1 phosphoribosylanthranilate isomerase [Chryseobacterium paridis]
MNQRLKLKVCGLTQLDQIQELISMNTDFLGFIFYEKSLRYVLNHLSIEKISTIDHQGKTGVFVNEAPDSILKIAEKADLNFIQLHGDEDIHYISDIRKGLHPKTKIIKVFRIGDTTKELKTEIQLFQSYVDFILFDTDSKSFGGTGKQFDWSLLNGLKLEIPYFLSGGISQESIEDIKALQQKPFALDINSKFEIEAGVKDLEKVKLFKSNLLSPNLWI